MLDYSAHRLQSHRTIDPHAVNMIIQQTACANVQTMKIRLVFSQTYIFILVKQFKDFHHGLKHTLKHPHTQKHTTSTQTLGQTASFVYRLGNQAACVCIANMGLIIVRTSPVQSKQPQVIMQTAVSDHKAEGGGKCLLIRQSGTKCPDISGCSNRKKEKTNVSRTLDNRQKVISCYTGQIQLSSQNS